MPGKEREVIILDEEDNATSPNGRLEALPNLKTKVDRHGHPPHSDLKHNSVTSVQSALRTPSVGTPTKISAASHDISPALSGTHHLHLQGSSDLDVKLSFQQLHQTPSEKTTKTFSLKNKRDPACVANSSWSFAAPAATSQDFIASSRPSSISDETQRPGREESAGATITHSMSSTKPQGPRLPPQRMMTELTDDDESTDEENLALWMAQDAEDELRRSSLASSNSKVVTSRRPSAVIPRNLPIASPFVSLDTFTHNGILLAEHVYVELQDNDFLRIVHIIQDTTSSAVTLRGWKFRRTREMNGVIERKLNEVCWILHIDEDDPRDAKLQGMETVPVYEIVKRRRIRLTNQSFPALSWRDDGKKENPETIENDRILVCRSKYLCFYANAKARASYLWCEKGLHRLREDECDQRQDNTMKDEELRSIWRGHTMPGGAQEGWLPGEKEFLRQEEVSHKGIVSRSSLKVSSGLDFPIGDPMKRGSVGILLTENDLQRNPDRATHNTDNGDKYLIHTHDTTVSKDDVEEVPTSPILRPREQRQDRRKSHFNFVGLNGLAIDSSDYDTDEDRDISAVRRDLRKSSIESRKSRNTSPRVVEIDAQVKTFSSSGTFEKRYEGKITSRYYPTPALGQRKRPAEVSFGSPTRPTKKADRGFRVESSNKDLRDRNEGPSSRNLPEKIRQFQQEPVSSDSDVTVRRSQSPDCTEEMYTPSRSRGYTTTFSGLLSPISQRRDSTLRRPTDTVPMQSPGVGDFAEYTQQSKPISKTAPSSVVNQIQPYGTIEDDDGIIDLTRPQPNLYRISPSARLLFRQSEQSTPLYARSFLSSKLRTPREKSSRPTFSDPSYDSKHHLSSTKMRPSYTISPSSPPVTPGSSQACMKLSHQSYKSPFGSSSRATKNLRQRNQSTTSSAPASKTYQQRYTFGDCFCGAGGMSRGAVSAGLRVNWGFDFNLAACQTYAMNFFRTPIYNVWANQFSEAKDDHKVDILHLSPPCQFFSDAHTVQGKDDEMNTASLFAIFNLLDKAKPRIVTLEQTSGLIRRHAIFFNAVINMFTSKGFSVRWKVINCADFGLPQRRTRLFIMASCPGEVLPPFPKPAHSSNPKQTGLSPWTTINEAISNIPHGWPNHDIHFAKERDSPPQSGDTIATCVTTSGGGIIHPSGKRDYTHREFACLQKFPLGHKFGASGVKRQVGNAVPPIMAQILLETVKSALLKADDLL